MRKAEKNFILGKPLIAENERILSDMNEVNKIRR